MLTIFICASVFTTFSVLQVLLLYSRTLDCCVTMSATHHGHASHRYSELMALLGPHILTINEPQDKIAIRRTVASEDLVTLQISLAPCDGSHAFASTISLSTTLNNAPALGPVLQHRHHWQ